MTTSGQNESLSAALPDRLGLLLTVSIALLALGFSGIIYPTVFPTVSGFAAATTFLGVTLILTGVCLMYISLRVNDEVEAARREGAAS